MGMLNVNGRSVSVDVDPDTALIYVLRNDLALNGPKLGCGNGLCGACTVHVDGRAVRSCQTPVKALGATPDRHARRPRPQGQAAPAAGRLHRRAGAAVRLLHQRHDHGGGGAARGQAQPHRGPDP